MTGVRWNVVVAVVVVAACSAPAVPEHARDAATEHAAVRSLLYEQGMIEDAEVQARMSVYVLRMRRNELAPERGYREFREWLEAWSSAHPERVQAARARRGLARDGPP